MGKSLFGNFNFRWYDRLLESYRKALKKEGYSESTIKSYVWHGEDFLKSIQNPQKVSDDEMAEYLKRQRKERNDPSYYNQKIRAISLLRVAFRDQKLSHYARKVITIAEKKRHQFQQTLSR